MRWGPTNLKGTLVTGPIQPEPRAGSATAVGGRPPHAGVITVLPGSHGLDNLAMVTTAPSAPSARASGLVGPLHPWLTVTVFVVTAATGIAQLVHPSLYDNLSRIPSRIDDGEWWRLITAMFFQDGWAAGLLFNLTILAVFGVLAERTLGRPRWVLIYFGCGLFGQTMSYLLFHSTGAGNSMCVAGLIGALTITALLAPKRFGPRKPPRPVLYLIPILAVIDTVLQDNHGLPLLLGMLLGVALLPRSRSAAA